MFPISKSKMGKRMLIVVEIHHLDEATLYEAEADLDAEMLKMGFTRLKELKAPNVCSVYYDLRDMRVGLRPHYLAQKIDALNQKPDRRNFEFKIIAEKNMPNH